MIGNIFYFFGLIIAILSFSNLFNYFKFINIKKWIISFKKITKKDPERKDFRKSEDYNIFTMFSIFTILESLWILFGIITSSWYIFLSITLLNLILRLLFNTLNKFFSINLVEKLIGFIFNLGKFTLIIALIMNHFHFHVNLIELIR